MIKARYFILFEVLEYMSLSDKVDKDQTARSVQSDLYLLCPQTVLESRTAAAGLMFYDNDRTYYTDENIGNFSMYFFLLFGRDSIFIAH